MLFVFVISFPLLPILLNSSVIETEKVLYFSVFPPKQLGSQSALLQEIVII